MNGPARRFRRLVTAGYGAGHLACAAGVGGFAIGPEVGAVVASARGCEAEAGVIRVSAKARVSFDGDAVGVVHAGVDPRTGSGNGRCRVRPDVLGRVTDVRA
jgi:hypothetical protein